MRPIVPHVCGVYAIVCGGNGKIYIGSSVNVFTRLNAHKSDLRNKKHYNEHLQRSFDKYGERSFRFQPLWVGCESVKEIRELEAFFAEKFGTFNMREVDPVHGLGELSEESKRKITLKTKGVKRGPPSETTRQRISEALTGKKGPPRSEEFKENLRRYHKSKKRTPEHEANLLAANKDPEKHKRIGESVKRTLAAKKLKQLEGI